MSNEHKTVTPIAAIFGGAIAAAIAISAPASAGCGLGADSIDPCQCDEPEWGVFDCAGEPLPCQAEVTARDKCTDYCIDEDISPCPFDQLTCSGTGDGGSGGGQHNDESYADLGYSPLSGVIRNVNTNAWAAQYDIRSDFFGDAQDRPYWLLDESAYLKQLTSPDELEVNGASSGTIAYALGFRNGDIVEELGGTTWTTWTTWGLSTTANNTTDTFSDALDAYRDVDHMNYFKVKLDRSGSTYYLEFRLLDPADW